MGVKFGLSVASYFGIAVLESSQEMYMLTMKKAEPSVMKAAVQAVVVSAAVLGMSTGCSTKNYVRSQTTPIIQQTNGLDAKTAADHRTIVDTDERAQRGIAGTMDAANTADQHAGAAGSSADAAGKSAQGAVNRVDSLSGVIANLDNYKELSDINVTFGFDKAELTLSDKKQLDSFVSTIAGAKGYILQVTGGTDTVGDAQYNYQLSQRRADAVVNYLSGKHNIPPHKFFLVGIGKDVQVASDRTAAGRAKNRRVEIKLLSNMSSSDASSASLAGQPQAQQ